MASGLCRGGAKGKLLALPQLHAAPRRPGHADAERGDGSGYGIHVFARPTRLQSRAFDPLEIDPAKFLL